MFGRHHEQVFAFKAFDNLVGFRCLCDRVGVPAHHGFDGHIQLDFTGEHAAKLQIVDDWRTFRDQVRAADDVEFVRVLPNRELQCAAAYMAPCAYQRRQAGHGAYRLAAAIAAFQCNAQADGCRWRGSVLSSKLADICCRDASDFFRPFRCSVFGACSELCIADGMVIYIILIYQAFFNDGVHHGHRQCAVGAGFGGDMPVCFLGGFGCVGIDDDHFTAFFLGFLDDVPMVQVGADRVAGPDHNVFGVDEAFRVNAGGRANGQQPCRT